MWGDRSSSHTFTHSAALGGVTGDVWNSPLPAQFLSVITAAVLLFYFVSYVYCTRYVVTAG